MNTYLPTTNDLQTANQARITWTILAALVLLCALEQILVLAQSGFHVFPLPSRSKAYVVGAASHYLFLLYLFQAVVTLQHIRLAKVPPFPLGFTEAVRSVKGFRFFTDRVLVWLVPMLLLVFFARMLTYQVENIQTGEILVDSPQEHLIPGEALLAKALDVNYAGTNFMLFADDIMPAAEKRVSYFPLFAPYALLIEALLAVWFAWRIERERRRIPGAPGSNGHAAIFISYRRSDTAYVVDRLSHTLAGQFGRESVFRDVESIAPGEDLVRLIEEAIAEADVVLAVIGKEWLREPRNAAEEKRVDWVVRELTEAIEGRKPLIPVLVQPVKLPDESELPPQIRSLCHINGVELHPDPYYASDLNRLVSEIRRILDEHRERMPDAGGSPETQPG